MIIRKIVLRKVIDIMWKKILLSFPLVVIVVLFFSWNNLVAFATKKYLDTYCLECFGRPIDSVVKAEGNRTLIFEKPTLLTAKSLEEKGLSFKADKVTVRYQIRPFFSGIDLDITVEKPDIALNNETDVQQLIDKMFHTPPLLTIYPHIHVNDGVIRFCSFEEESAKECSFYYSTTLDLINKECGSLRVCFNDPSYETNSFEISVKENKNTVYDIEANFRSVDFGLVSETIGGFFTPMESWIVTQGFVDGNLILKKEKGKRFEAAGNLSIKDLILKNSKAEMTARIGGASINLSRNGSPGNTTIGKIELTEDASISLEHNALPTWSLEKIQGGIIVESHDGARINFTGLSCNGTETYLINLTGEGRYFDEDLTCLSLDTSFSRDDSNTAHASLEIKQLNDIWYAAKVGLQEFGYREFQFVQQVMRSYSKDWDKAIVHQGSVDATATMYIAGMSVHNLDINSFSLHDVSFEYSPWKILGSVNEAKGFLTANFSQKNFLQSLNSELSISDGLIKLTGEDKTRWQLTHINTHFTCKNGTVQKSSSEAMFAGLKGTINYNPFSKDEVLNLKFKGSPREIIDMIPEGARKNVEKTFINDSIAFSAGVKLIETGLNINGIFEIEDYNKQHDGDIAFGFDIEQAKNSLEKDKETDLFNEDISLQILPPIAAPIVLLKTKVTDYEKGIAGYIIRNGWLYSENLSLSKYIAPFTTQNDKKINIPFTIAGEADIYGSFNHLGVAFSYDLRNFSIESDDFRFDLEKGYKDSKTLGVYYADFNRGSQFGKLPVEHGSYLEKNSKLLFTEISAIMKLSDGYIHASDLDAYCQGIHFGGNINIDNSSPDDGIFDVEILADTMDATITEIQSLFSHFDKPPLFTNFPMKGNLHFQNEGGHFLFNFRPEGTAVTTSIDAVLKDGSFSFKPLDMSLQEMDMNIHYDQKNNTLTIDEIRGTLLAGPPDNIEEYLFAGDKIAFTDFNNNIGSFDLWIGDKHRDIIRIAGSTTGKKDPLTENEEIHFHLNNNLSHFGDVHPSTFNLSLENWASVRLFKMEMDLKLETLLNDLQKVSRTGIFFLSENILKEINAISKGKGLFKLSFDFDNSTDIFRYKGTAEDVEISPYAYKNIKLDGKVKNKVWSIDQFQIDDLSLSGEMVRELNYWKINYLGLKSGHSLLLGLEGEYRDGEKGFDAKINLFEINFSALDEWPQLSAFVENNKPGGLLRGRGKMRIEKCDTGGGWRYDGSFTTSSKNMTFRNLHFADAEDFSCHFVSDKGLTLRKIKTALLSPKEEDTSKVGLHFEKIYYDTILDELEFEGVNFSAPTRTLAWYPKTIQKAFPADISDDSVEMVASVKESGSLIGTGNLKISGDKHLLTINLADGAYLYGGSEHKIRDFNFSHRPGKLLITMKYLFEQRPLMLAFQSNSEDEEKGFIVLKDLSTKEQNEVNKGIVIQWETDPNFGFNITEAKGSISGLQVNLKHDFDSFVDKDHHNVAGTMIVSFPQASNIFQKNIQESILENSIGGHYQFNGHWSIGKESNERMNFKGNLQASNFTFKGYHLDHLKTELEYHGDKAHVKDLVITDSAGVVTIPVINLSCHQDKWYMLAPMTSITSFRPSQLKDIQGTPSIAGKSLIIPTIEVKNLKGEVSNTWSWTGEGMFTFKNTMKKTLQNTILAVPHEIITRIGLNPAVLTPVTGTILYRIEDRKILFTKFKDVYSDSKASKFFLPRSSQTSYIDFDKNLNLQVRMKQHNLLFKIAELFIFTVKGTLENPLYTIQKQN